MTLTSDHLAPAAPVDPATPGAHSRRDVLRTAGIVALSGGAALTLAACGADGQAGAPVPTSAAPTSAQSSSAASSPSARSSASSAASPSKSAAAKAPSGPSIATADVPVGGGVILSDADYVITQPTKGTYKAFSKICTHQGCKVGSVADGVIKCPCHGSQFSIEDGSVKHPPAPKPLPESATTVSGSKVYVTG
jgi:Rieske Fe-S protein